MANKVCDKEHLIHDDSGNIDPSEFTEDMNKALEDYIKSLEQPPTKQ